MSGYICVLITVLNSDSLLLNSDSLLRCALKLSADKAPDDCIKYYREDENMAFWLSLLPLHVKSCGPIVHVEEIFEIVDTFRSGQMDVERML